MSGLEGVTGIHAKVGEGDGLHRLALGLHDVRQLDETRLVEAQVGGDDGRQVDFKSFQACIHFSHHRGLAIGNIELAGEGRLRAAP